MCHQSASIVLHSWRLGPHIEGGRLLWPLLKAGMTVLTQFFCKMYFLYVSRGRKKTGSILGGFTPLKKLFFPTPGSSLSFTKIAATLQKLRLLSNSRVAYDHRTQLKSFTKIAATLQKLRLMRIYTPPIGGHHRQPNKWISEIKISWVGRPTSPTQPQHL